MRVTYSHREYLEGRADKGPGGLLRRGVLPADYAKERLERILSRVDAVQGRFMADQGEFNDEPIASQVESARKTFLRDLAEFIDVWNDSPRDKPEFEFRSLFLRAREIAFKHGSLGIGFLRAMADRPPSEGRLAIEAKCLVEWIGFGAIEPRRADVLREALRIGQARYGLDPMVDWCLTRGDSACLQALIDAGARLTPGGFTPDPDHAPELVQRRQALYAEGVMYQNVIESRRAPLPQARELAVTGL